MGWDKKWWWLIGMILAISLIIWRTEKRGETQAYQCRANYIAQLPTGLTVYQQATTQEAIAATCEPNGYFYRLFSPANLPTLLLVIIGIGATWAALRTLVAIEKQADAMIASERAWVIAELVPLCTKFQDGRWYRRVANNWAQLNDEEIMEEYFRMHTLRFTNMGRTPAHIIDYEITYSCFGEGVTTISGSTVATQVSRRPFDHLLNGGDSIGVPETVDVGSYMASQIEAISQLKNTAIFHGWVRYQHVFSNRDILKGPFWYSYKPSDESLVKIHNPNDDEQKQT